MKMSTNYDGNMLAGPLSEVFTIEVTAARARCGGCGRSSVVADLVVYGPDPGLVARCPGCEDVMLRLVRGHGHVWLDLSGTSALHVESPDDQQ
jgi:hypothetical protein